MNNFSRCKPCFPEGIDVKNSVQRELIIIFHLYHPYKSSDFAFGALDPRKKKSNHLKMPSLIPWGLVSLSMQAFFLMMFDVQQQGVVTDTFSAHILNLHDWKQ